jgi:N-acetyl-beta-hexosaminidase
MERSPKCIEFMNTNAGIKSINDIKEYFAGRVGDIVGNHGLDISAWEDGLMHGKNPFNFTKYIYKYIIKTLQKMQISMQNK